MLIVLDTNVLYGQFSRYMLLSLAVQGVLLPFWSPAILDELTEVLLRHGANWDAVEYQRRKLGKRLAGIARVGPLPAAPPNLELPDPDDWSVIATAIVARAPTIVTWDRGHFPRAVLEPYGLAAMAPDRWCPERLTELQHTGGAEDVYDGLRRCGALRRGRRSNTPMS